MVCMWMVCGEGGSFYDVFCECGVVVIGWNQLVVYVKLGIDCKQLIDWYKLVELQVKYGIVVLGVFQVWWFVNEI